MKTNRAILLAMIFIAFAGHVRAKRSMSLWPAPLQQDTLVQVAGKVVDDKTGDPIQASIFYEKLPYYDNMGTAKSNQQDGAFGLYLYNNTSYNIKLTAQGYDAINKEFRVLLEQGKDSFEIEFRMVPDKANQMIVLENLIFERGRSKISPASFGEIDRLVEWLNERPSLVIQLEGHTDFEGNENANMELSLERVDAVREYLVSKGIKKNRVQTKAFGGSQPLTLERTDEGKRKNRRVEVRVIRE